MSMESEFATYSTALRWSRQGINEAIQYIGEKSKFAESRARSNKAERLAVTRDFRLCPSCAENAIYAGVARDLHIRQPKELARFQSWRHLNKRDNISGRQTRRRYSYKQEKRSSKMSNRRKSSHVEVTRAFIIYLDR